MQDLQNPAEIRANFDLSKGPFITLHIPKKAAESVRWWLKHSGEFRAFEPASDWRFLQK